MAKQQTAEGGRGQRILIAAPSGCDAEVLRGILRDDGVQSTVCRQPEELCRHMERGAAAAIIAGEFLTPHCRTLLYETLSRQPEWSDFPLILMTGASEANRRGWDVLSEANGSAHAILLERPVRKATLLRSLHTALRSRFRQYQVRDELSRRAAAEAGLRESEERFRMLTEAIPAMVWASRPDGRVFYINQRWTEYTGQTVEEYLETGWADVVHPDDRAGILARWQRSTDTGELYDGEVRYRRQDGAYRWHYFRATPMRDHDGNIVTWYGASVDIHDRKVAEEALRESEQRLAAELTAMTRLHEIVARLLVCPDLDSALHEVLDAAIEITGGDLGNVQLLNPQRELKIVAQRGFQRDFLDYFETVRIDDNSACARAMRSGERIVIEDVSRDPLYEPYREIAAAAGYRGVQSTPLICRKGEVVGMLSTHYRASFRPTDRDLRVLDLYARQAADFIERKETERSLRELNEQLEQRVTERTAELERQNQRLRRLAGQLGDAEQKERRNLARLLHDGLQQILIAGKMQMPFCLGDNAEDGVQRLGSLLDEAIEASRSLSYELSPPMLQTSDLPDVLDWLARWFRANHRFDVTLRVGDGFSSAPDHVKCFLFDAVRELLLNSVKHSGRNSASVGLTRQDAGEIRITVSDEGRGFDPADVNPDTDDHLRGFGLFSIQERLIALGGNFEIDAAPGAGARFVLSAPVAEEAPRPSEDNLTAQGPAATGRPADPDGRVRILIVDDHGIVREGLISLLEREEGIELVGEAGDGVEAIQQVERLQPHVVLMDVNMPRMNGIVATREIKRLHPEISIIGLSFHEEREMAEGIRRAGASAYLQKGGDAETLIETIRVVRVTATADPRRGNASH